VVWFQPRRYEVTGTRPVLDHQPGEIFEADIPLEQEERLVQGGAIRVIPVEPVKSLPPLDSEPLTPEHKEEALNG
jgi:hypothetical protein